MNTLTDYVNDGYDNLFEWSNAQNDPKYQYGFTSSDSKTLWMGKGLGGGTLHFGLQYIDTAELIDGQFNEWKQLDGHINVPNEVNNITGAERYNYSKNGDQYSPNQKYYELKEYVDANQYPGGYDEETNNVKVKMFNNKIYSNDIASGQRLLLGDLIKDLPNVDIEYKLA